MKEAVFISEFRHAIKTVWPDTHIFKIPDSPVSYTKSDKRFRFTIEKPYDLFCVLKTTFFAFEFKMVKTLSDFDVAHISPHQIDNLEQVCNNGGASFLVINYRCGVGESPQLRKRYGVGDKQIMESLVFLGSKVRSIFCTRDGFKISLIALRQYADFTLGRKTVGAERIWDVGFMERFFLEGAHV